MFSDFLGTKTLKKVIDMKKYTIKNERITLKENVLPTIDLKIYVLAATSALLFVGGIRLICELLVMIQAA
jgi:hypothetical protein